MSIISILGASVALIGVIGLMVVAIRAREVINFLFYFAVMLWILMAVGSSYLLDFKNEELELERSQRDALMQDLKACRDEQDGFR